MKVALPSRGGSIDPHFGHCAEFTIFSIDGKSILQEEKITPPAGCGCKTDIIPQLVDQGVTVMLAGNMGEGAAQLLRRHGIDIYRGLAGGTRDVTLQWLEGQVVDSGVGCGEHGDHGCGSH